MAEENQDQQRLKAVNFMANGLLNEVTFVNVVELVKSQAWKEAEDAYDNKLSDEEKAQVHQKIDELDKQMAEQAQKDQQENSE